MQVLCVLFLPAASQIETARWTIYLLLLGCEISLLAAAFSETKPQWHCWAQCWWTSGFGHGLGALFGSALVWTGVPAFQPPFWVLIWFGCLERRTSPRGGINKQHRSLCVRTPALEGGVFGMGVGDSSCSALPKVVYRHWVGFIPHMACWKCLPSVWLCTPQALCGLPSVDPMPFCWPACEHLQDISEESAWLSNNSPGGFSGCGSDGKVSKCPVQVII